MSSPAVELPVLGVGLTHIKCPDGVEVTQEECFARCRMRDQYLIGRCYPLPLLVSMFAKPRPIVPSRYSTTELTGPTRLAYLKRTTAYSESPDDALWRTWGTAVHSILEQEGLDGHLAEIRLHEEGDADSGGGQFDLYDAQDPECPVLNDWKVWGSFKVEKILKAESFAMGEALDTAIQVNRYRQKLERAGFPVKVQAVTAILRDWNYLQRKKGIPKVVQLPVGRISDRWLDRYFEAKRRALQEAEATGYAKPCPARDRWGGRRCRDYCPVRDECVAMSEGAGERHPVFGWPSEVEE